MSLCAPKSLRQNHIGANYTPNETLDYATLSHRPRPHDTRCLHVAVLLRGRRVVGEPVTNALNVYGARAGPRWVRTLSSDDEHSVHAETRATQRLGSVRGGRFAPQSRRARRAADRRAVGAANGVCVGRFTRSGQTLLSRPCLDCVRTMRAAGLRFVVYSANDGVWLKESLCVLEQTAELASTVARRINEQSSS